MGRRVDACNSCNKTYYGDTGKTYYLELHRPKEDKVPYFCKLTFNAPGGELGDIVQLTFDSFTLGKFVSFTAEGCPDGSLQISEAQRPDVGGLWCGTSWGPAIYYSETPTVTISLRLLRLSQDQTGFNFDFRMAYKMIRKSDAVVRYGNPFVGMTQVTQAPMTLLDISTEYSNVTMAMPVQIVKETQPTKPTPELQYLGDLISVRQPRGQLIAVRARPASQAEPPPRELRLWQDCDIVQDYVTVYDGYTTRDPVILKFCGGGEPVPEATSSGAEILVEFTTSPYGTFLHPTPPHSLHGFQLEIQVKFVDADSPTYAKNKRCEFWLKGNTGGVLASPRHTLPRNTTCLYHLRGAGPIMPSPTPPRPLPKFPETRPGTVWRKPAPKPQQSQFRVWLSVLKFHVGINPTTNDDDCSTTLFVWDGDMMPLSECNDISCEKERLRYMERTGHSITTVGARPASNTTLLARYCKDKVPKTCDHAILQNTSRPCSLGEGFISSGSSLTIEIRMVESTALRQFSDGLWASKLSNTTTLSSCAFTNTFLPVNFRALYEFVDLHQDGDAYGNGPCSRIFYSRNRDQYSDRYFRSPRNIFLYGRGGSKNLTCVYRFEGEQDEVVKLRFNKLLNGNRTCRSVSSVDYNRLLCVGSSNFSLKVFELPWSNASPVQRDCLCSNRSLPINIKSLSNIVEVHFTVYSMNALDDYNNLFFEGVWDFMKAVPCLQNRRVRGPSGMIQYESVTIDESEKNCKNHPWLIDPGPRQYLYVKTYGIVMKNNSNCLTTNRIVIHTGGKVNVSVCPKPSIDFKHHTVEVFSEGWSANYKSMVLAPGFDPTRTIAVEFIMNEMDTYTVTWLELTRRPSITALTEGLKMPRDCEQRCPELNACINASLWCDGTSHCPSGYDEALTHCSMLLRLPPLHLAVGAIVIVTVIGSICFVSWRVFRRKTNRSISQHRLKSISSETAIIDGKEVIC
ncbi:hypothetical protein PV328_008838 [Microctonus aethiopoides]|uniref:CUB domain-containing protein n=1 Tax=Microctonus aethiopoides TaxID=144406 RepID=A0AA39FKG6_9HYME|nr:hypothetical protein PV328_008838 [Microctonus aethiopoides]